MSYSDVVDCLFKIVNVFQERKLIDKELQSLADYIWDESEDDAGPFQENGSECNLSTAEMISESDIDKCNFLQENPEISSTY